MNVLSVLNDTTTSSVGNIYLGDKKPVKISLPRFHCWTHTLWEVYCIPYQVSQSIKRDFFPLFRRESACLSVCAETWTLYYYFNVVYHAWDLSGSSHFFRYINPSLVKRRFDAVLYFIIVLLFWILPVICRPNFLSTSHPWDTGFEKS